MTKARIDLVASDDDVERLVHAFCNAALKEKAGDGKIFVHPARDAIRIRTRSWKLCT